jgi:hypothetical protein
LPIAAEAPFNAYSTQHEPVCLPNTRTGLLQEIYAWADSRDERFIFWLNGLAGTGKSTIARTVARNYFDQKRLGASFFFSRGGGDVSHAGKFVSSVAVQLASSVPSLHQNVCDAILEDNHIARRGLRDQWNQLILRPFSQLRYDSIPTSFIIVIDALDECEGYNDIRLILHLLAEANNMGIGRLRIFLTSRPDTPIRLSFRTMPRIIHHDLVLHDVSRADVNHDIAIFLKKEFQAIRDDFDDLPSNWPEADQIEHLVQRSGGLFIYAATACRFIKGDGQWLPQDLLDLVLDSTSSDRLLERVCNSPSQSPTWELDEMYMQILQRSIFNVKSDQDNVSVLWSLKHVIGSLVIQVEPLSAPSLANILQLRLEEVNLRIRHLHSVLNVPQNQDHPIRLFHPSFRDFLLDNTRCKDPKFWVNEKQAHRALAESCIRLMSVSLKQDICGLEAPGILITEVESSVIEQNLPLELQYACLYWINHLEKSGRQLHDDDHIHKFLEIHLLHWLEALILIKKASGGVYAICSLESLTAVSKLLSP